MQTATMMQQTDEGYDQFEAIIKERVAAINGPVFSTTADPDVMWATYLGEIPEDRRQHYTCNCCKKFIQKYGGLVTINEQGIKKSVLWADFNGPEFFLPSVVALSNLVVKSNVTGVYLWSEKVWGIPQTKDGKRDIVWTHLSGETPSVSKTTALLNLEQLMAEKKEDFGILERALKDYPLAAIEQATRILTAEAVFRSEKALGIAKWFLELAKATNNKKGPTRWNMIWLAVVKAPAGYCHVRSTMISTLLDDIIAEKDFDDIKRNWNLKMDPRFYQRPQAAPKEGNIKRAEEIFAKMDLASSLKRKAATLSDVQKFEWLPRPGSTLEPSNGIFGHLKAKKEEAAQIELPATTITWEKFARTILPNALEIEVRVPYTGSFYGLVTAADPTSKPILQWDTEAHRNPVSWFFKGSRGSRASEWGIYEGWTKCNGIFQMPCHWAFPERFAHFGKVVFFALEGARIGKDQGTAIFPETLRNELREVSSVIEAHSKQDTLLEHENGNANGIAFQGNSITLRIKEPGGLSRYTIDRLD